MGNTDSLPVVSQAKSLVQAISGDTEGATQTQKNFVKGCPIVSQGVALGAWVAGDSEYARETQEYFVGNLSNVADGIPVVGHIKGGIHYLCGDAEGGANAMRSSSRSTAVAAGGIGGFIVGGPVGAIAGGVAAGGAADGIITGVESAIEGEYRPYGHVKFATDAINGDMDAGSAFDWAVTPVFDGFAGRGFAKLYQNLKQVTASDRAFKTEIRTAMERGDITLAEGETITSLAKQIKSAAKQLKQAVSEAGENAPKSKVVGTMVLDVEGNKYVGYSFKLRQALDIRAYEGQVPTAQQIIEQRLPGRGISLRGASAGEPQCAEVHALHEFHKANGLSATPAKTITIQYDGSGYTAFGRCGNCAKVGKYVLMGEVVTDGLNGSNIPLSNATITMAVDLLCAAGIQGCNCDHPH